MSTLTRLTPLLIAVTLMFTSQASALSVREYKSKTTQQRAEFVNNEINRIIADTARVNPAQSKAIHDYFWAIPQRQPESRGLIAFGAALLAAEKMADQGKLDLDQAQIESLLLGLVKRDVISKQKPNDK
jgi:hypothetical protein